MNARQFFTHPLGVITAATGATFLWGSAFPFVKLSYQELQIEPNEIYEQMLFAGYRFVAAALLIMMFSYFINRGIRYQRGSALPLLKIGLFQTFLQYLFFYIGLSHSTGIRGSITVSSISFFQILLAHFMYKNDLLSTRKLIGVVIGFTGVVLANMSQGSLEFVFGLGELLLLFAAFSGALGNILVKKESGTFDILYITSFQMFLGGLGLTLVGASQVGWVPFHFNMKAGWMFVYLSFLSAAGFLLWNNVMKYNKVGRVSMYMFLIPVFGVFLSAVLLQEAVHVMILAGLMLVVAGIVIVNRGDTEKKASTQQR
ncbi:MAG: DMT family transporter [Bacillaceae bacterium]|nr:DMT family transporter [Bacillaceae bacterium]